MKRWCFSLLLTSMILILFPFSTQAQQSTFALGDQVIVNTGGQTLNLRASPGTDTPILAKLPNATYLRITGGPQPVDGYTWWQVEGSAGSGWVAENFIQLAEDSLAAQDDSRCETSPPFAGIQFCNLGNQIRLITIDLDDPHLRFETVLGSDWNITYTMPDSVKETIPQMALRYPAAAAAITADYSGSGHGPEGLTIKNGTRLDGIENGDNDNGAVYRSSLIISQPLLDGGNASLQAKIVRLTNDRQELDPKVYYTAAGGGPPFIFNGVWEWARGLDNPRDAGCSALVTPNDIINGECFNNSLYWDGEGILWTVFGITEDHKLVWLIAPHKDIQVILQDYHVVNAIKMDGGGSSQMWYAGETVFESTDAYDRQLASGLLVFYLLSFEVEEQPNWPVIVEGESLPIKIVLRNNGSDTWKAGQYKLVNIVDALGTEKEILLQQDVKPGGEYVFEWIFDSDGSGWVRISKWVMSDSMQEFPDQFISLRVIVIPEELEDKKEELEAQIKEWLAEGVDKIEQAIIDYISREIQKQIDIWPPDCCLSSAFLPLVIIGMLYFLQRRLY